MKITNLLLLSLLSTNVAFADKNKHCDPLKNLPSGTYSGLITFANGNVEPITFNFGKDGSVTAVSRFEFPTFIPGVLSDLESALIGQWKSNCDGKTFKYALVARRQAAEGGGLPAAFGYTVAELPSLPNYTFVVAGNITISKSGLMKAKDTVAAFGNASYGAPGDTSVLLTLTQRLPIVKLEAQRQSINDLYNAIPK